MPLVGWLPLAPASALQPRGLTVPLPRYARQAYLLEMKGGPQSPGHECDLEADL